MTPTRTLLVAAAAFTLAACGSGTSASSTSPANTPPTSTSPTEDASPSTEPAEALRVVDLSGLVFELAAMDVPIVGGIYSPEFAKPTLDGLEAIDDEVGAASLAAPVVTDNFVVDAEQLATLDADVIVIDESYQQYYGDSLARAEKLGGKLVVIPTGTWQQTTQALADAVGVPDEGRERVAAGESAVTDLTTAVEGAGLTGSSVSLLRFFNEPLAFVPPSLPSQVVTAAGLVQPAAQGPGTPNDGGLPDAQAQKKLSPEVLGDHDADVLLFGYNSDPAAELATFEALPTVARLGAVTAGKVGAYPYFLWALNSAVGVERIAADLQAVVVDGTYAPAAAR